MFEEADIATPAAETPRQATARLVLGAALVLLALWTFAAYLPALGWAGVIAIASWPFYKRMRARAGAGALGHAMPALFATVIGLVFLAPVVGVQAAPVHEVSRGMELGLMGLSAGLALIVSILAWARFSRKPELGEPAGFGKVLANKWYVDEIYDTLIVRPLNALAKFFNNVIEKWVIDGLVNGIGRLVQYGSRQLRLLQSGQVGGYVLLMVIGILALFLVELFKK